MSFNASEVIAGRNFIVYSAPYSASNALPADTVDYGTAWGSPWVNRGYTSGGLTLNLSVERGEIRVDQEFDPVFMPVTNRTVQLSCNLAQITPENYQLASGLGTLDTVAPTESARGHVDLKVTSEVQPLFASWGYDILQPDGMPFRVFVPRGMATGSPQSQFTADNAATIALEITALVDTNRTPPLIAVIRDVLPPTS
jgi:hypothetical protein